MIRKLDTLKAALAAGATLSRLKEMKSDRFRIVLTETSEPVHGYVLRRAMTADPPIPRQIAWDLTGEPMQWAWVDETQAA